MHTANLGQSFELCARRHLDRLAVRTPAEEITYGELNRRANRVAHATKDLVEPGDSVATLLDSDVTQLAAFLAALKIGGRFVPVDPRLPLERARFILEDARASVLLTNHHYSAQAAQLLSSETPALIVDALGDTRDDDPTESFGPDTHTWIVYTSGTTGAPKGVLQTHRNLSYYVHLYTEAFALSERDRVTTLFPFHVNGGLHDILLTLLNGAALHPWDAKAAGFSGLSDWLRSQGTTIYSSVPTAFRQLVSTLQADERIPSLRLVRLWGEPSYRRDFESFQRHTSDRCQLVNRMGASETGPIAWRFFDKQSAFEGNNLPVGWSTAGHEVQLLDDSGHEAAAGEPGEIVVRSRFLSPGYWQRDVQTRRVFADDVNDAGVRLYRTGDVARRAADGCLIALGRKDSQVKIRGYRIEVDEIAQALASVDGVSDAVVLALTEGDGESRLAAYFVAPSSSTLTVSAIRRFLAQRLPEYMIPSVFVRLDAFPLAPNGKVARRALPMPERDRPLLDIAYAPAVTPDQQWLVDLWQEVLGLNHIGIDDPFMELGGDSLSATRVVSRVSEHRGLDIGLGVLFANDTIATFARALSEMRTSSPAPD